jgi:hypothetical protein
MERYTKEQRVIIVKTRYKYGENICGNLSQSSWSFRSTKCTVSVNSYCTVKRMIKKFEETGSIMDSKLLVRHRTGRSLDNCAEVSESVAESPGT